MKNILIEIWDAICTTLETYLFNESMDLISLEAHKILNHPEDRIKLLNAFDELRSGIKQVSITLHTGEVLILS